MSRRAAAPPPPPRVGRHATPRRHLTPPHATSRQLVVVWRAPPPARHQPHARRTVRCAGRLTHPNSPPCAWRAQQFLREYNPTPFKAVVKPVEGAGSDGVSICNSAEEVRSRGYV